MLDSVLASGFQLSVVKPLPNQLPRPITRDADSYVEVITGNRRQTRENGREFCQPIREHGRTKSKQTRITFDTQLKTVPTVDTIVVLMQIHAN